ncbi:hypothetical protein BDFB_004986 [Asbolus verrucosus]|uniref:Nose resistant-to-fluoxetine protein N-terminal domain-containing protein n=1 Tax=Asbolus verrucosus TaxID=1661398 RepID=A0A482V9P6_ASBVE|nr:hypothetical protein BDFB_004986 [Asbolus verrucosus]
MIWTRILFWCVVIYQRIEALHFENLNVDDILKLAVPTVKSTNAKCKNHSRFYLEELKNLKLWATEMFDASSKFPSGVLHGSAYDFGNFDECIHVKLPSSQEKIVGKYCMAKFHIAPPNFEKEGLVYRFQDTDHFDNATTWEKVLRK